MFISWIWFFSLAMMGSLTDKVDKTSKISGRLNKNLCFYHVGNRCISIINLIEQGKIAARHTPSP
jgi:hypothetical protein